MRLFSKDNVFVDEGIDYEIGIINSVQFRALFLFVTVAQAWWLWHDSDGNAAVFTDDEKAEIENLLGVLNEANQTPTPP